MAITYPLALPAHTGIRSVSFRARNAVAYSMSPFTFAGQAHQYAGQMWEADITLPPLRDRADAEQWNAFLVSLNGQAGTFLLGDPNGATPRGTALSFKKNLLTFTEQFDNAAWIKIRSSVTPNAAIAPDGTLTADKLVDSVEFNRFTVRQTAFTPSIGSICGSVFVKEGERRYVLVRVRGSNDGTPNLVSVIVDLQTGLITAQAGSLLSFAVEPAENGFYRIVASCAQTDTTRADISMFTAVSPTDIDDPSYTGDGTSGIFIWGAQIEAGSVATEYQPIADGYGPFVNGAGQTGSELIIDGASPNEDAYLRAGDYIQLGAASSARLHKVLADVATDDDGNATIDIWPSLRSSPADNSIVIIENCKGRFRLAENVTGWNADVAQYGISFSAMEAV